MTCRDVETRLSQYIDGELEPGERADVSAHLESCAACRALASDFARVRDLGRALGPIAPPEHIWLEVAGQMRLTDRQAPAEPAARRSSRTAMWQWLGLAAALVLTTLVTYAVTHMPSSKPAGPPRGDPAAAGASASSGTASVETVAQELSLALEHYDKAIADLEVLAKNNDGAIDPTTAATLQRNLGVIDQAIAESRAALSNDPQSQPAFESLVEALRRKVAVLETTVALMNEMRRGNQEGAARVVAGAGKS